MSLSKDDCRYAIRDAMMERIDTAAFVLEALDHGTSFAASPAIRVVKRHNEGYSLPRLGGRISFLISFDPDFIRVVAHRPTSDRPVSQFDYGDPALMTKLSVELSLCGVRFT